MNNLWKIVLFLGTGDYTLPACDLQLKGLALCWISELLPVYYASFFWPAARGLEAGHDLLHVLFESGDHGAYSSDLEM